MGRREYRKKRCNKITGQNKSLGNRKYRYGREKGESVGKLHNMTLEYMIIRRQEKL